MTILMLATSDDITLTPYAIKHSASVYVNNGILGGINWHEMKNYRKERYFLLTLMSSSVKAISRCGCIFHILPYLEF